MLFICFLPWLLTNSPVIGLTLALCCHHRCDWKTYTGKDFFHDCGFTAREFQLCTSMTSWATCGTRPVGGQTDIKDTAGMLFLFLWNVYMYLYYKALFLKPFLVLLMPNIHDLTFADDEHSKESSQQSESHIRYNHHRYCWLLIVVNCYDWIW